VTVKFRIELLAPGHDRGAFSSGVDALDRYFRDQAMQDMRRRASACYVAVDEGSEKVAGYYTLTAAGVPLADLPPEMVKRLPRYPSVPVAHVGRLAVGLSFRNQKLGAALLADAVMRAVRSEIAIFAFAVDAKDDTAASFYLHHGFVALGSGAHHLVLPLAGFKPKI
jgi:GNAT superfamily N-acetyltransferase